MTISFKNFILSSYESIDYKHVLLTTGDAENRTGIIAENEIPTNQGYFTCTKEANLGRMVSLIDIASQVAKLIIDTAIFSVTAPLTAAASAIGFTVSLLLFLIGKNEAACNLRDFSYQFFLATLVQTVAIPVCISAHIFTIITNVGGIICPKVGQEGRSLTKPCSVLYQLNKKWGQNQQNPTRRPPAEEGLGLRADRPASPNISIEDYDSEIDTDSD